MLDVSQTVSYEVALVCLPISPSVGPSLSFHKTGSLAFSEIVHDDR